MYLGTSGGTDLLGIHVPPTPAALKTRPTLHAYRAAPRTEAPHARGVYLHKGGRLLLHPICSLVQPFSYNELRYVHVPWYTCTCTYLNSLM